MLLPFIPITGSPIIDTLVDSIRKLGLTDEAQYDELYEKIRNMKTTRQFNRIKQTKVLAQLAELMPDSDDDGNDDSDDDDLVDAMPTPVEPYLIQNQTSRRPCTIFS